jgi:hypothetical protein
MRRLLVRQRAMRQRAHQELGVREAMPQRGFQFGKIRFHMRLNLNSLTQSPKTAPGGGIPGSGEPSLHY